MNNKLEGKGSEAVVAKYEALFQHFPERTEENHEEPQPRR
jgi:hypothetical protein